MLRKFCCFFSTDSELSQPLDESKQILNQLDDEISQKKRSALKVGTVALMATLASGIGMYLAITAMNRWEDYRDRQKNPDTWDQPCGDMVANISQQTGQGYTTAACFGAFSYEFDWTGLNNESPECYAWCRALNGAKSFGFIVATVAACISVSSFTLGAIERLGFGLGVREQPILFKHLSDKLQINIRQFLPLQEFTGDMTVKDLRDLIQAPPLENKESIRP
jgi:hypothetical protein